MLEKRSALSTQVITERLGRETKGAAEVVSEVADGEATVATSKAAATEAATVLLAASLPEMLLRAHAVCAITGLSVPTVYRLIAKGDFPRPVQITGHARAWKLSELMGWIESREPIVAECDIQKGRK
jgi:prophage regulatory protein